MDLKIAERKCNRKITVFDYHPKLPAGILTSLLLQGPLYMWDAIVLPAVKGDTWVHFSALSFPLFFYWCVG